MLTIILKIYGNSNLSRNFAKKKYTSIRIRKSVDKIREL